MLSCMSSLYILDVNRLAHILFANLSHSGLLLLLLLLSRFSRVRLCATPQTAAHQALLSLGFSRQEHWSGLPFPSAMCESESEVAQSCPTLCDPMDCSLPGSSVHGIFQARVLGWGAIAFSVCACSLVQISLTLWVLLCRSNNTDNCVPGLLWEVKERKIQAQSRFSLNAILFSSYILLRNWRNSSWGEAKA